MTTHKMVGPLLLLARTCMCTNTCEEIFTKKKRKYQDTINFVQKKDMVTSIEKSLHSLARRLGHFHSWKETFPLAFLELMTAGKDVLQHIQTLFVRGKISNYHGNLKFSNLIFCMVVVLSFLLGFRSYVTTRSCCTWGSSQLVWPHVLPTAVAETLLHL